MWRMPGLNRSLVFRAESRWSESLRFRTSAPQATSAEVRCHGSSLRTVSDTIPYSHGAANMTLEPYLCGLSRLKISYCTS